MSRLPAPAVSTVSAISAAAVLPGRGPGRGLPRADTGADVLRILSNPRTAAFLTVHQNGRRRYGYWQAYDSATGTGGCHVALPTAVCDELERARRITFGEPVVDPTRTTYRVLTTRRPESVRTVPAPARATTGGFTRAA
ncbi:hypothetical protein OG562_43325 [Streptomyces sp. NBC_01275]|uniref:hypothetical protein n=1 Tax=Streptomyces sp. NBC_01275 TaxID=2903807 RepID=UPI002257BB55|nr:hypothetical protein [Streptomyces sp. NBC_01275]MCX4767673.1 hypothetical protein [Streptomyces sp. NBC_01275]